MAALLEAVGASLPPAATLPIRVDERPGRVAPTAGPPGPDRGRPRPGAGAPGRARPSATPPARRPAEPSTPGHRAWRPPGQPDRDLGHRPGPSGLAASGLAASGRATSGVAASGSTGSRPGSGPFDVEAVERAEAAARTAPTTVGGAGGDGVAADAAAWVGVSSAGVSAPGEPPSIRQRSRRKWPWIVGVVVLAVAVAAGLLAAHEQAFTPSHPVPSLDGQTLAAAHQAATADHFTLAVGDAVYSTSVPAGTVISQQPRPKTTLKEGSVVHVVPSKGLPSEPIPSLAGGLTCDTAVRLLAEAHFKATCPALLAYTTTVPSGPDHQLVVRRQVERHRRAVRIDDRRRGVEGQEARAGADGRRRGVVHSRRDNDQGGRADADGGAGVLDNSAGWPGHRHDTGRRDDTAAGDDRHRPGLPGPADDPGARRHQGHSGRRDGCPAAGRADRRPDLRAGQGQGVHDGPAGRPAGDKGTAVNLYTQWPATSDLRPLRSRPHHAVARGGRRLLGGRL